MAVAFSGWSAPVSAMMAVTSARFSDVSESAVGRTSGFVRERG